MRKSIVALSTLVLLGGFVASLPAIDDKEAISNSWARFRGPNGTGVSIDKDVPTEFGPGKNILWKTKLPGIGHSSPIVWGNRVFVESASADGGQRLLVCLNTDKGNILWSKSVSGEKAKTHLKNNLASSTPATDGERVYAAFWDGHNVFLHAFDMDGNPKWKQDLGSYKSQHGAGGSPVVWKDKVFFNFDQDGDAAILAFNAKTGQPIWKKSRDPFRACYSTPFLSETPTGATELIVASTAGITSYQPDTGDENWKWIWKFTEKMPQRTVGSPIISNGLILACSGDGSGSRHMVAVQPGKDARVVWENKRSFPYVPTLLTHGEHVYFVNDGGIAACHKAGTGAEVWKERLGGGFTASPVLIDGKIYAPSEDGSVYVFAAEPTFKLLARNTLADKESIFASPAVAANRLFLRGENSLYCIGKKSN